MTTTEERIAEMLDRLLDREATARRILSPMEAAASLGIQRTSIYRLVREGRLRAVTIPGISGIRFLPADLDAYVATALPVAPSDDDGRRSRSRS